MASMRCACCGGVCHFEYGKGYVCSYCGRTYTGTENADTITDKLNFANAKRIEDYDFEGASKLCNEVLDQESNNQEANFWALLAEYQIVYLKNAKGDYKPTFLNPDVTTPINECKYYQKLNTEYRKMADFAETVRLEVVRESQQIPDYDVFISYKQHIDNSDTIMTEETEWAAEIYKRLSKTGLRVFYDEVSLKEGTAGWEPHIYSALKSAKYLILLGSSVDNINSTWVKNEWKRFLSYRKKDSSKTFSVVKRNFKPEELDFDLQSQQMLSVDKTDWADVLVKNVSDYFTKYKVEFLLEEAKAFILKRKFKKAKQCFVKVCSADPRNAKGYWGLLNCKFKAMDDYDLVKSRKKIGKTIEYKNALQYAGDEEAERYKKVCNDNLIHNKIGYDRTNYNEWKKKNRVQRFFKKAAIIAAALVLCAFGVYTYFGITQPVNYSVENGTATLSGRSIYFNLVVNDLEVDTYKDYPVVKIGDGALKNSNIKTFTASDLLKEVGNNAFENCLNLTSVTIADCTYLGSNAFNACIKLNELKIGITDESVIEADAFANIGRNATVYVPTVAEKITTKLKSDYPTVNFVTYTRDEVEECTYFINKLSSVSFDSENDILKAENLYNDLSPEEKSRITNYGVLQNAKAAYNAAVAINDIGEITLGSEEAILKAEDIYASLTDEQKKVVSNYMDLTTARAVYNTMSLIDAIGEVEIDSEPKIVKAEEAYLALSYEQRDLVSNYSVLTAARTNVDILLAKAVIDKIAEIGDDVTLESDVKITAAETAYNSLTDGQKNRVTNYAFLTDARAVYNVIKAIDNIGTITVNSGSSITIAQKLYDGLTSAQKLKIVNYTDLTDAADVYPVVVQIGAIGNVLAESITAIENAEAEYAKLSVIQQTKVSNYGTLKDCRAVYKTVLLIDEIGEVLENGAEIETAQNSYNGLTESQKAIVGNYSKLSDAAAVYNTIKTINAIGDVSLDSLSKISVAETNYNNLTSSQKQLVTNYQTLVTARAIYNVMTSVTSRGTIRLGKGTNYSFKILTSENMVNELNDISVRNAIDSATCDGFNLFSAEVNSAFFEAFPNLDIVRFDISKEQINGKTYIITSACTSVGLIGNYAYTYSDSQIKFESRYSDVSLELWNFNITSMHGKPAIDATEVPSQYTVKFSFVGSCTVNGVTGSDGSSGKDFKATSSNRTGTGGSGYSGGSGTSGIIGNTVKINVASSATVTITGGAGGIGGNGGNSACYSHGLSGRGKLGNGGNGGTGGTGGDGIYVSSLYIENYGAISLIGGNGGNGGTGGAGANDPNYGSAEPDDGGDGGKGGKGGTGGYGIRTNSIVVSNNKILVKGGRGGDGGKGGKGGTGDTESPWYPNGSYGGDGGQGGDGGTGGTSINITCNNASLSAGKGGAVGVGGALGVNRHNSKRNGSNGKNGSNVGLDGIR